MISTPLFIILVAAGMAAVYKWATRFPECSANDILPFLRKIDMELVYGTFHPDAEAMLRERLPAEEFPEAQFKRIKMAIHYCRELAHNARFFRLWAEYERRHNWHALNPELREGVTALRVESLRCRMAALYVRTRLRWWLLRMRLVPWATPPSFSDLTRHGSPDMVAFYEKARDLAEAFGQIHGETYYERLQQAL